ncbi:MBL fold metallo-hydrolase [Rhodococcus gannanensis]|uniref:MBL fold metallo-hydrolase n=1 Tax=Rhodococcus gannanensis TaxID=1960308 RepID=A0ABW4P2R8_9NOCA
MTFTCDVGAARITQLTELARWPFPVGELFPAADEQAGRAALRLKAPFVDQRTGDLVLAIHTHLIRIGDATIVVDTGNGNHKHRPNLLPHHMFDTDYEDAFAETETDPGDVDLVISTHLHPDHCGWNTRLVDGRWVPTFGNATYLFGADELAGAQVLVSTNPDDPVRSDLVRAFHDSVQPVLDDAAWTTVTDGHVLAVRDGTRVVVRSAPGHTPGHLVVEVNTPDGGAVLSGDVIHHPLQFLRPDLAQAGDSDPVRARTTREALLDRCARDRMLLMPAHFPVDEPVVVILDENGRPTAPALLAG